MLHQQKKNSPPKQYTDHQTEEIEANKQKVNALEKTVSEQTVNAIEAKRCKDLLILRTQELDEWKKRYEKQISKYPRQERPSDRREIG